MSLQLTERAWYRLCLACGWLLRSARYSSTRIAAGNGVRCVRKRRRAYAPALVWLSGPLMKILDTGVRVLHQRAWERRERDVYDRYLAASIDIEAGGTLVLPHLPGRTLADLLEDRTLEVSARRRAIALAVSALAAFHRLGLTHGDALAGNVLVDLDAARAVWFDFETAHDPGRSATWRRADDLRALLSTCLVRTSPADSSATLTLILEAYADDEVADALAASFGSVWRRSLAFHLAQAPFPFHRFRDVVAARRERLADVRA